MKTLFLTGLSNKTNNETKNTVQNFYHANFNGALNMITIEEGLCTENTQAFRKRIEPHNYKTKNQKTILKFVISLFKEGMV